MKFFLSWCNIDLKRCHTYLKDCGRLSTKWYWNLENYEAYVLIRSTCRFLASFFSWVLILGLVFLQFLIFHFFFFNFFQFIFSVFNYIGAESSTFTLDLFSNEWKQFFNIWESVFSLLEKFTSAAVLVLEEKLHTALPILKFISLAISYQYLRIWFGTDYRVMAKAIEYSVVYR